MFNTGYSTDKRRRPSYLYFKKFRLRLAAVRHSLSCDGDGDGIGPSGTRGTGSSGGSGGCSGDPHSMQSCSAKDTDKMSYSRYIAG